MVLRQFVYRNKATTPVAIVDVAPCKTASTSVTLTDNSLVTTAYCYLNSKKRCIEPPRPNAGQLRVECPPMVEYRFSGNCPCAKQKTLSYGVRAPAGSVRKFTVTMVRTGTAGRQVRNVVLQNGVWTSLPTVTLGKGDKVQLSVTVLGRTTVLDQVSQDL